jgi:hypothetical protein
MPDEGMVHYEFKEFKIKLLCELRATELGYLQPIVYDADLDFGYSYLYHEN